MFTQRCTLKREVLKINKEWFEKNKKWLAVVLIPVLLVIFTGLWGYNEYLARQQLEIHVGNNYQRAFYELVNDVEDIQVMLGKALVSVSPRQNIIGLTNIWNRALNAQQQLTNLPLSTAVVHRTAIFLAQAGDYAYVMARKNAEGRMLTDDNRQQLEELRQQAIELSSALNELENQSLNGDINWKQIVRSAGQEIQHTEPAIFQDGFDSVQQDLNKYPTLIYDGPFSDHVTRADPRGLVGDEINRSQAEEKAKEAIDIGDPETLETIATRGTEGRIEAYNFTISSGETEYFVDISKKGGHVINLISDRKVTERQIGLEEAAQKARKYVAAIGYPNMVPTYSEIQNNTAFVSLAYKPENVIYYSDLITVQVALDNSQIISVEAINYLNSHRERDLEEPELTPEEVANMVGLRLDEITDINLALIPQENLDEVLTYEVKGSIGDQIFLVYVNVKTGVEEEILQLFEVEEGTFTI